MKINRKILAAFIGYLKNSGHGLKEKNGCLVMRRNNKEAIIDCNDDEDIQVNQYAYQLYMTFMYQWLNKGKVFIDKMRSLGLMVVFRIKGKNYKECEK